MPVEKKLSGVKRAAKLRFAAAEDKPFGFVTIPNYDLTPVRITPADYRIRPTVSPALMLLPPSLPPESFMPARDLCLQPTGTLLCQIIFPGYLKPCVGGIDWTAGLGSA